MYYSLSSWCGRHFGTIFVLHFHWKWELWALCCFCRPLLCCLCCTVYLPSSLLTRCSAQLSSRCSVQFSVTVNTTFPFTHTSFELVQLQLTALHHIHFFCLVGKTSSLMLSFFPFPDFLEYCNTLRGKLIILGDFNIHCDSPSNPLTLKAPTDHHYIRHCSGCLKSNPPLWAHHRLGAVQGKWTACSFLLADPCTLLWPSAGGVVLTSPARRDSSSSGSYGTLKPATGTP